MRSLLLPTLLGVLVLAGCGSSGSSPGASSSATSVSAVTGLNHVHSIAIMPRDPNVLYLGAHYHLYKSTDGGRSWHPLSNQMMLSIALDEAHPSTIYAVSSQRGLQKTTDGGAHWTLLPGVRKGEITGVVVNGRTGTVLAYGTGMEQSTDGGMHWTASLKGQSVESAAFGLGGTAYAATGNGLFLSRDAGLHWKTVSAIGNQPAIQVAASGSTAYALTALELLRTRDDGRTWRVLKAAPTGLEFLGVAPNESNEVFGEVALRGFVVSHDGGATWHGANSGIHDRNFNASTVRIAPSRPEIAYTGSWGLHFYATRDGGKHWTLVSTLMH